MVARNDVAAVDAFDLPDWLGTSELTWTAGTSVRGHFQVSGRLTARGDSLGCDLLAADQAFPQPVLDEEWRRAAHQSWTHGEVLFLEYDGRLTLAVPGTEFTADRVLDALARLAKAIGVAPDRVLAAIRL